MLIRFLLWCTVVNASLIVLLFCLHRFAPDFVFWTQKRWLLPKWDSVPEAERSAIQTRFQVSFYAFLMFYRFLFAFFNLVPLVALLIVASQ